MKNYYRILNVPPTATDDVIKRSYRLLAKKYHPDVNPDDKLAADKFTDINEAYDTLSDAALRSKYDAALKQEAAQKTARPSARASSTAAQRQQQGAASSSRQQNGSVRQQAQNASARQQAHSASASRGAASSHAAADKTQASIQAQIRAQVQEQVRMYLGAVREQAFAAGRNQGVSETRAAAEKAINKLKSELNRLASLCAEKDGAINKLNHRNRELESELLRKAHELENEQMRAAEAEANSITAKKTNYRTPDAIRLAAENERLQVMLETAQTRLRQMSDERTKSQLDVISERNDLLDDQEKKASKISELTYKVTVLAREAEEARAECSYWQMRAIGDREKTDEQFDYSDWLKKIKADRRLAKPTLYGALGLLIWATEAEINAAFTRLVKYYSNKYKDKPDKKREYDEKLQKLRRAHEILSDVKKRREYNEYIGISEDRIESERNLANEKNEYVREYRDMLADKAFWQHYDETVAAALSGDADAQNELGKLYYDGHVLSRDYTQAVFWFKEAAKQMHPQALGNLGACYINGEGVEKSEEVGNAYIRQAEKISEDER